MITFLPEPTSAISASPIIRTALARLLRMPMSGRSSMSMTTEQRGSRCRFLHDWRLVVRAKEKFVGVPIDKEGAVRLLREGYHERLFLLTDERKGLIVRKEAKAASSTLLAEIAWLEELPAALHRYFPRVLRSGKDQRGQ